MADHTISLSNDREAALQRLVDQMNTNPMTGEVTGTKTKDELLREWILQPIKEEIRRVRALNSETIQSAYETATQTVKDQVEALLGIDIS